MSVNTDSKTVVTEQMMSEVDWEQLRDVDIAKIWNITRERVRQIRAKEKFPACKYARKSKDMITSLDWLLANRTTVEGQSAYEVIQLLPTDATDISKLKALRKSGIPFDFTKERSTTSITDKVNWKLPNGLLEMIWKRATNWAGNMRSIHKKGKSKWRLPHDRGDIFLVAAVELEIKQAQQGNVRVPLKKVLKAAGISGAQLQQKQSALQAVVNSAV